MSACKQVTKQVTDYDRVVELAKRTARKEGWGVVYITRCAGGNYDFTADRPGEYVAALFVEV